ncbi:MAG: GSCFA domain-containing protein [Tidjanibacter sp.]|nr:GSCFA domain-containing protein [Tidjanibacter sp.]
MKIRTEISIAPSINKIDQRKRVFSVGSCFAEEIAQRLVEVGIPTLSNPLGVLYNPLSIEECVERACSERGVCRGELMCRGDMWFSLSTHGVFDNPNPKEVEKGINDAICHAHTELEKSEWVILTLGTAWVYEHKGQVVANCHKLPAKEFSRRLMTVEEVVRTLWRTIAHLSGKKIILTISPVRYVGDGLEGNAVSKAILRLAVEEVVASAKASGECVGYFPSYEIFIDDLRDYRYYGDDMVHPSKVGVEYVWEKFCETFLTREALANGELFARLRSACEHRPLHPESEEYRTFRYSTLQKALSLQKLFPNNEIAESYVKYFAQ